MTKCKKPTPYDPKLIAAQCNPVTLRLGCAAGCWKGEDFDMCGKPVLLQCLFDRFGSVFP